MKYGRAEARLFVIGIKIATWLGWRPRLKIFSAPLAARTEILVFPYQ
jgi:hypothetical protein